MAAILIAVANGCEQASTPSTEQAESSNAQSSIQNPKSKIQNPLHFTDITASTGIDMIITCGGLPTREILEVNGGGLALIDYDNDGDLDLFVANGATMDDPENGPGCRLYENLGDMKFRNVTTAANIRITRWATGAAVGDFNGDGFDDIYICCYGPNILLHNNGDRTFSQGSRQKAVGSSGAVTEEGVLLPIAHSLLPAFPEWSTSAAFGDLDNDGDLDLYVCNYLEFDLANRPARSQFKGIDVMGGPHGLPPQHDVVYENQGLGIRGQGLGDQSNNPQPLTPNPSPFVDVTELWGCRSVRPSFGMNVVIIDFDHDGWQDITVANDSMPDFLFQNRGKAVGSRQEAVGDGEVTALHFAEIGVISGIAANADGGNQASMGLAIADVDGNGFADKFTTVFSSDVNALHMNQGLGVRAQGLEDATDPKSLSPHPLLFEDRSQQYGLAMVSRAFLGWSAGFFDFDHDGDEDLLCVNGHVYPEATMQLMDSEYEQPPLLFERDGARFKRVSADDGGKWLGESYRDRNAVFADLDSDGDIDIIIGELNGPIRVLRNDRTTIEETATNRDWLIVELKDDRANSMNHRGLGARIELHLAENAVQRRWLFTGGGFQSSGPHYAHFGLGEIKSDALLRVKIIWPDGFNQIVEGVKPNQHLIVKRES